MKNKLPQIIMVYGILGILFSIIGLVYIGDLNVGGLSIAVEEEFHSMAMAMQGASTASENAAVSIRQAKTFLGTGSDAAVLSGQKIKEISPIFEKVRSVFSIVCVLGGCGEQIQWLEENKESFFEIGISLQKLGGDLEKASENLEKNAADMDKLSADFGQMSTNLQEVAGEFDIQQTGRNLGNIVKLLLVWMVLVHVIFVLIGYHMR